MSATLTEEVDELKSVVLRNPVTVKLSDSESTRDGATNKLTQYVVRTTEDDKFLLIYVILKLKLVKGKILIFVNDTDRGYRLKLFLEKFGIRAGVLNAELPFNSRWAKAFRLQGFETLADGLYAQIPRSARIQ